MTDATQGHRHAHDHAVLRAQGLAQSADRAPPARASLLEASAVARLSGVSLAIAALWAGVYWALH
ncbi:hypothetical protein [Methylocystis iwaonis]|uniref:Uncharacterized protein n=1 Tax=Methylocystis iwaonis TaxID=2885079 RepID=A0ABN6VI45_9HYPH|nr:hypothetical protein [Methylocystis iwaonis]BDV35331.1 hypothetical protein SS37A_28600 [Methylocystis iwaonis]